MTNHDGVLTSKQLLGINHSLRRHFGRWLFLILSAFLLVHHVTDPVFVWGHELFLKDPLVLIPLPGILIAIETPSQDKAGVFY